MVNEIEICIVVILKVFSVALLFNLTCLQNVCVKYTLPLGMNVRRQSRLTIICLKSYKTCLQCYYNCYKFAKVDIKKMQLIFLRLFLSFSISYVFSYIILLDTLTQVQFTTFAQNQFSMKVATIKYLRNHCAAMYGSEFHHNYYFLYIYVWYYTTLLINGKPTLLGILSHVHVLWRTHVDSCVKVVITVAQIRCLFRPKNILLVTYRTTLHCVHTQSVDFYTHKLLLIKDLFNAVNNLNSRVYAIFRQVKGCNCKMTTTIYTAYTCSLCNIKVVRLLYCFPTGSRTLQCKKACIHNVNYYTLLLPLATMCSKSPTNLDTMIDIHFYYSTKGRFSAMIHVHHGSGDNGTLCTLTLVLNVFYIIVYILGDCTYLLVLSPLDIYMQTKRVYWFIYSFKLNYEHFRLICTAENAERILFSIALVLLIIAIIVACILCISKQLLKSITKNQYRFSNNFHVARECLRCYTIIYFNNG